MVVQLLHESSLEPRDSVEKMDNFLASRRWLRFFKISPEVALESANLID
jgi:hypothetical protein